MLTLLKFFLKGTFDSHNLVEHYVNRVLKPYFDREVITKSLIVLDSAKCHQTQNFRKACENLGCELVFIPGGLTGEY